jgi:hypothetical protein
MSGLRVYQTSSPPDQIRDSPVARKRKGELADMSDEIVIFAVFGAE